jgi:hypothetical protein
MTSDEAILPDYGDARAMIRLLQEELAETNRGLIALTMELEERVEARTAQLEAAIASLHV